MLEELYELFGEKPLDCEFAVTSRDDEELLWLLQARPLVLTSDPCSARDQHERLGLIRKGLIAECNNISFLMSEANRLWVMPDWNPAEIVGVRPKPWPCPFIATW